LGEPAGPPVNRPLACDSHHRRPQDPIAQPVPALYFADDLLAGELIGILVSDGFVHVGIKRIAGVGRNWRNARLFQRGVQFALHNQHTVEPRIILQVVGQCLHGALKIVHGGQHALQCFRAGSGGEFGAFGFDATLIVGKFRAGTLPAIQVLGGLRPELLAFRLCFLHLLGQGRHLGL